MAQPAFDDWGNAYARHTARSVTNAYYDRPAILDLVGDVKDLDVLDVGCAAGHLSAELLARGARVTALDVSATMVELARTKTQGQASMVCANIGETLPLPTAAFDAVAASLVLHYLRDWVPALTELRRVLRPGGVLVFSVHHPEDWHWFGRHDYFSTELIVDAFTLAGRTVEVEFYRRPLGAMFSAIRAAGFVVDNIVEPMPRPEGESVDAGTYFNLTREPRFLYFVASPAAHCPPSTAGSG